MIGKFIIAGMMTLACFAALSDEAQKTDGEVWNEGVEYYNRGDATNAMRVLRPLMLSRSHGARAAELVAKLCYERGDLEESAVAAQIALRKWPQDDRVNRNYTRATDKLPELREQKRMEQILKQAQGQDPGEMLVEATIEVRNLMSEAGTYRTNEAMKAVLISDALSSRAEHLADKWIPVREVIAQSVTNEEQAATIIEQLNQAQAKTQKAAKELSDIDGAAYSTLADVENDFTRFMKLTIMPPPAMSQDLLSQSNAWQDVEMINNRPWQKEALDFTRAFRSKFPAWARAYEQQAQSDTNKPPFTAEAQSKISALATELEKLQLECCEKQLPPSQEKALEIIRQIMELLPKDNNQNNHNQQNQNQQNNQNQQQKQDQQQQQNQEQKQDQQQQGQQQDQQQDQKEDQDDEQEPKQGEEEKPEDQEVEAVLKKAQERNDEHEADKKARMRKMQLPPNERDW